MGFFYHCVQKLFICPYCVVPVLSSGRDLCLSRGFAPARLHGIPAFFITHLLPCHPGSSAADNISCGGQHHHFIIFPDPGVRVQYPRGKDTCSFFQDEGYHSFVYDNPFLQIPTQTFRVLSMEKPPCPFEAGEDNPFTALYFKPDGGQDFPVHYDFIHPVFIGSFVQNREVPFGDQGSIELFFRNRIYALDVVFKSRADISRRSDLDFLSLFAAPTLFSKHGHIASLAPVQEHFAKVCWSGHVTLIESSPPLKGFGFKPGFPGLDIHNFSGSESLIFLNL